MARALLARSGCPLVASASGTSQHCYLLHSVRPATRATIATSPVPYTQIPTPGAGGRGQNACSLSQALLYSLNSLPPSPPYVDLAAASHAIPPSFGFSQLSPSLPPPVPVKREAFTLPEGFRSDADATAFDDLINSYMDLDGLDLLNSSDDHDSRASGTRESSEKEADSKSTLTERKDGAKSHHCHNFSMDSFMGKFNLAAGDESPKLPLPYPSAGFTWTGSGSL
jgi:hypothetical protein